ncbi:MAG: SPASM domain-containing protein [Nitrospirae bacterium]|nr:SPASM domain-containing protein [Nitrospirota bacterium]
MLNNESNVDLIKKYNPLYIGKLKRLPSPSNLIIDIHSYCNASCKVCPYADLSRHLTMGHMEECLFKRIIDEFSLIAKNYPVRAHVIFCNMGELFIDPNVFDKISYVLESGLKLIIQTNASLLTPRRVDKLIATGFKGPIYISCHGITKSVYKNVMGLDINKTLNNIDYLIKHYPRNLIRIRAISYKWPVGEALKVKKYWKERSVQVKIFLPNSRAGLVFNCTSWKSKYPGNKLKGCKKTLPLRDMVIAFNGDAVLCCEDMGRKAVLGNLKDKSIVEVWNSEQAKDILEKIFSGKPADDDFICKKCEFGVSTLFKKIIEILDHEWHRLLRCHI